MAVVKFPFYVISGDYIFPVEDHYIVALRQETFWSQEELNAWIVSNLGRVKSSIVEPPPDYSPAGILKAWRASLKAWWRG